MKAALYEGAAWKGGLEEEFTCLRESFQVFLTESSSALATFDLSKGDAS